VKKNLLVLGLAAAAIAIIGALHAMPVQAAPLLMVPIVGMALQVRTPDETKGASSQLRKLEFSDDKDGAMPVVLTCGHDGDTLKTTSEMSKRWFGSRVIRKYLALDTWVKDVKTDNTEALLQQLETTKIIPWMRVTYMDGIVKTYSSGDNAIPVINLDINWDTVDKDLGWHMVGNGIIPA
jgi:hypothetical protein